MVSFCSWGDWKRRGSSMVLSFFPVVARWEGFQQASSSALATQFSIWMFLQWKCRDTHQGHWASLVPAAELLAVNNELVSVSLLFPCKQERHRFYPLVEHVNQCFVHVPWDCACLQKLSGFLPGRLSCWAVVLQTRKKELCRFSQVPRLDSKAVKGDGCFLAWYLVLVILILKYMTCRT